MIIINSYKPTTRVLPGIITWLYLTMTGNYQVHEFDWLKSILEEVWTFPSRQASRLVMPFAAKKITLKCKINEVLMSLLRACSYQPSNRAGSVTETNFVVLHMGNFSPGDRDEIQEKQPKW